MRGVGFSNGLTETIMMHRVQKQRKRDRVGLTLIELLVTISVMVTVASMFVVAYRSAATEAYNIRTQGTIRKINEVLIARMQEYENYPVSFLTPIPGNANFTRFGESPTILLERARLLALRETICLEMPDHPDDIKWTATWVASNGLPSTKLRPTGLAVNVGTRAAPNYIDLPPVQIPRSTRAKRMIQKLSDIATGLPIADWEATNANAELLYLIVEDSSLNDSSAIEIFGKSEIGDTDKDGLNEFLDSYGRPIQWIRWPTGFPGSIRYHPDLMDPMMLDLYSGANRLVGDSIDRMKADPGFSDSLLPSYLELRPSLASFPLVGSSGADGIFGLRFELDPSTIPSHPTSYSLFSATLPTRSVGDVRFPTPYDATLGPVLIADPWFPRHDQDSRLGSIFNPTAYQDDITNYDSVGANL